MWEFTAVSGQSEYELPTDWLMPVDVEVGGRIVNGSNPAQVAKIRRGDLTLHEDGVWFISKDQNHLALYPDPGSQDVEVTYVFTPPELVTSSSVPSDFPEQFHDALILHVGRTYYSTVEDDPEMAADMQAKYEARVLDLERFRIARTTGDRGFTVGIQ